jgi:uncharacterized protein
MSEIFDDRRRGLEEEYIRRKDREALDRLREQMKAEAEAAGRAPERLCPLGHGALAEIKQDEVVIDRCDTCGGIWLDAGELELLTRREEGGWLGRFRKR